MMTTQSPNLANIDDMRSGKSKHKKTISASANAYAQPTDTAVFESSIYQRFKMNSHKILIENPQKVSLKEVKENKKLDIIKKKL
jgi:hypothetical protein